MPSESIADALEKWCPPTANTNIRTYIEKNNMNNDNNICFNLKTAVGVLSYKSNDCDNYTNFLRVVIEMLLAFNSSELDPQFIKLLRRALNNYNGMDSLTDDVENDDLYDDTDVESDEIELARQQAFKMDEANKLITNLPKTDTLQLRILSVEDSKSLLFNFFHIEKIISKYTDLPPNEIHEILHNHQEFILPYDKATELYIQLRMLDVMLTIKNVNNVEENVPAKNTAAKKSSKIKQKLNTTIKKDSKTYKITGLENLKTTDGIIDD